VWNIGLARFFTKSVPVTHTRVEVPIQSQDTPQDLTLIQCSKGKSLLAFKNTLTGKPLEHLQWCYLFKADFTCHIFWGMGSSIFTEKVISEYGVPTYPCLQPLMNYEPLSPQWSMGYSHWTYIYILLSSKVCSRYSVGLTNV
jgi:hypothetical protein